MGNLAWLSLLVSLAVIQTFVFLLAIRALDLYQHEPLTGLGLMAIWGAVGATSLTWWGASWVLALFPDHVDPSVSATLANPIVEESAKGIALVAVFGCAALLHKAVGTPRLTGVTAGIVYGAAIGLGFAFTEDIAYLLDLVSRVGLDSGAMAFVTRRDFLGVSMLQHAIFTGCFGAALGYAMITRRSVLRYGLPIVGIAAAIGLHAMNNGLIAGGRPGLATLSNLTVLAVFVAAVALWLQHQRRVIETELVEEVSAGLVDERQADRVPRYVDRLRWYLTLVRIGQIDRAAIERRLHIELARLAFHKRWEVWKPDGAEVIHASRNRVKTLETQRIVDVYVGT